MPRRKSPATHVYKVIFNNQGQVYEIYARQVAQGNLLGFIEVEHIVFGERSKLIVDSSEERLKTEFAGVERIFIPIHAVVRIDEVEKEGAGRISPGDANAAGIKVLPMPVPHGGGSSGR